MTSDSVTLSRTDAAVLLLCAQRGDALERWISNTVLLGHATPAGALDYVHAEPGTAGAFVKDFVAWTSGRKGRAPGCEDRLREFAQAGLRDHVQSVADALMLDNARESA